MKTLQDTGDILRYATRTVLAFVIALLLLRALVEFAPAIEVIPGVRAIVKWWDPVLGGLAQSVGVPWSHDVRALALPGLAVALILLRVVLDDALARLTHTRVVERPTGQFPVPPTGSFQPQGTAYTPASGAPAAPVVDAAPGGLPVIGRYEILGELGKGAMGVVYKAVDPRIGRTVAIKTISAAGAGAALEEYRARFLVEAKSAGRLSHPGVVSVYDVAEDSSGRPCIVLEYVDGETLDRVIGEAPMPVAQALDVVGQVARALDYAHRHGIVHRDIKPANIMLTKDGQAKISDFGVAKIEGSTMTVAGQILGTPAFMSPEQCNGSNVDHRSDLFSLGTVLYTLLTGRKPFTGDSFTSVAYHVVHTAPQPVFEHDTQLPAALDDLIARCLAKDPKDRYGSGAELAADLDVIKVTLK